MYRLNWCSVEQSHVGTGMVSEKVDENIVFERYFALNWLTCYENADWDDIVINFQI